MMNASHKGNNTMQRFAGRQWGACGSQNDNDNKDNNNNNDNMIGRQWGALGSQKSQDGI